MTEKFICRPDNSHWCSECCSGRNCDSFDELADGTWGCKIHELKPEICTQVNCLTEMGISYDEAMAMIATLPPGEFFASMLVESQSQADSIEI